jgi:hypothetical protein
MLFKSTVQKSNSLYWFISRVRICGFNVLRKSMIPCSLYQALQLYPGSAEHTGFIVSRLRDSPILECNNSASRLRSQRRIAFRSSITGPRSKPPEANGELCLTTCYSRRAPLLAVQREDNVKHEHYSKQHSTHHCTATTGSKCKSSTTQHGHLHPQRYELRA